MDYHEHGEWSEPSGTSLMTQKGNDEAQTRDTVMRMERSFTRNTAMRIIVKTSSDLTCSSIMYGVPTLCQDVL